MMTPTGIIQPEDAKYIKRRIKSGTIDVHPTETALVVNYEVEAIILGESANPVLSDKKDCQKIIRLKSLNKNSDCAALAREVINKCSLIHPSKVADVEHLIYFLQSRKDNAFSGCITDGGGSSSGFETPQSSSSAEKASYSKLEEYVELLYETLPEKVRGAGLIMQLSRDTDNLEELARSDAVLSALARVLREDYKKSMELSTNIVSVFHSFSLFSQFHPLILQYKIGSLCIGILEFELQRQMQWKAEMVSSGHQPRKEGSAPPLSRLPLPRRSSTPSPAPPDRKRLSLLPVPKTAVPRNTTHQDEDSSQRKFMAMVAKQEKLLKVNFSLLLNIAENTKVEDKIRKRNIVAMLVQCLECNCVPLLCVVAKFLMRLSVRVENKDEMGNLNVIEKLPKLLQMNNFELECTTLLLLFNLSFDSKLRDKMVRVGFLQKLVSLLGDVRHTKTVLKLLYHLSLDDRVKAMFIFTGCLPNLMKMLVGQDTKSEEYKVLVGLCLNVALIPKCAEVMCTGDSGSSGSLMSVVEQMCHTCLAYQDKFLMKLIRNLSMHPSTASFFLVIAEDLLTLVPKCDNGDFLLECVGTLANLPLHKIPVAQLLDKLGILPWISSVIIPGKAPDDLVLEAVMMIGAASADEACAKLFCKADILISLIELLKSKQEDDEMVLQIIYVFYQISRHNDTRKYLISETDATAYLLDLMTDNNAQIRKVCDGCMDIIKDDDPVYEDRVKAEKFKSHNAHWLSMVENKVLETSLMGISDASLETDHMPQFNLLNQSFLMQTGSHISIANTDDIEIISNHPNSDEGSRPLSRYESEAEDCTDSLSLSTNSRSGGGGRAARVRSAALTMASGSVSNAEAIHNALRNLVIPADDGSSSESHRYFHLDDSSATAASAAPSTHRSSANH